MYKPQQQTLKYLNTSMNHFASRRNSKSLVQSSQSAQMSSFDKKLKQMTMQDREVEFSIENILSLSSKTTTKFDRQCESCDAMKRQIDDIVRKFNPVKQQIKFVSLQNAKLSKKVSNSQIKVKQLEEQIQRKNRQTQTQIDKENKLLVQYKIKDLECTALLKQNKSLAAGIEQLKKETGFLKVELQSTERFRDDMFAQQKKKFKNKIQEYKSQLKDKQFQLEAQKKRFAEQLKRHQQSVQQSLKQNKQAYLNLQNVLKRQLQEKQQVIQLINKSLKNQMSQSKNLSQKLSCKQKQIQNLKAQYIQLKNNNVYLNQMIINLELEVNNKNSQIIMYQKRQNQSKMAINDVKADGMKQCELLKRKHENIQSQFQREYTKNLFELGKKCDTLQNSLKTFQRDFQQERVLKENAIEKNAKMVKENKQLKAQIKDLKNKDQNNVYQIEALSKEKEKLKRSIVELNNQAALSLNEISELQKEVTKYQGNLQRQSQNKYKIEQAMKKMCKQKDQIIAKLKAQIQQYSHQQQILQSLSQDLRDVKQQLEMQKAKTQINEQQLLKRNQQISSQQTQLQAKKTEIIDLRKQIADLQSDINNTKKSQSQANVDNGQLLKNIDLLKAENVKIQKQIKELEHQNRQYQGQINQLKQEVKKYKQQEELCYSRFTQLQNSSSVLAEQYSQKIDNLTEQLIIEKTKLLNIESEYASIKKKFELKEKEVGFLNRSLEELRNAMAKREVQNQTLSKKLKQAEDKFFKQMDSLLKGKQADKQVQSMRILQMKAELIKQNQLNTNVVKNLNKLEEQYSSLQRQNMKEIQNLKNWIHAKNSQIEKLVKDKKQLQIKIQQTRRTNNQYSIKNKNTDFEVNDYGNKNKNEKNIQNSSEQQVVSSCKIDINQFESIGVSINGSQTFQSQSQESIQMKLPFSLQVSKTQLYMQQSVIRQQNKQIKKLKRQLEHVQSENEDFRQGRLNIQKDASMLSAQVQQLFTKDKDLKQSQLNQQNDTQSLNKKLEHFKNINAKLKIRQLSLQKDVQRLNTLRQELQQECSNQTGVITQLTNQLNAMQINLESGRIELEETIKQFIKMQDQNRKLHFILQNQQKSMETLDKQVLQSQIQIEKEKFQLFQQQQRFQQLYMELKQKQEQLNQKQQDLKVKSQEIQASKNAQLKELKALKKRKEILKQKENIFIAKIEQFQRKESTISENEAKILQMSQRVKQMLEQLDQKSDIIKMAAEKIRQGQQSQIDLKNQSQWREHKNFPSLILPFTTNLERNLEQIQNKISSFLVDNQRHRQEQAITPTTTEEANNSNDATVTLDDDSQLQQMIENIKDPITKDRNNDDQQNGKMLQSILQLGRFIEEQVQREIGEQQLSSLSSLPLPLKSEIFARIKSLITLLCGSKSSDAETKQIYNNKVIKQLSESASQSYSSIDQKTAIKLKIVLIIHQLIDITGKWNDQLKQQRQQLNQQNNIKTYQQQSQMQPLVMGKMTNQIFSKDKLQHSHSHTNFFTQNQLLQQQSKKNKNIISPAIGQYVGENYSSNNDGIKQGSSPYKKKESNLFVYKPISESKLLENDFGYAISYNSSLESSELSMQEGSVKRIQRKSKTQNLSLNGDNTLNGTPKAKCSQLKQKQQALLFTSQNQKQHINYAQGYSHATVSNAKQLEERYKNSIKNAKLSKKLKSKRGEDERIKKSRQVNKG